MIPSHPPYHSYVFDCDGVILDSNKVKTEAFYNAALPYGDALAAALVEHHVRNGGISRYRKFEYFLSSIVPEGMAGPELDELLDAYAAAVRTGLMNCKITPQLAELRDRTADARWYIVSGGDQMELRDVFAARGLAHLFDGGIFGSPDNKHDILRRELAEERLPLPALFLGDSLYDYEAASRAGLDFVFVHGWTEVQGWSKFVADNGLRAIKQVQDLESPT